MESSITSNDNCNNGMKLLDAAMEGRADDAVELLKIDPSLIHIADPVGDTAFHVAARAGNGLTVSKMINFLVRNHLSIDKGDPNRVKDVLCKRNAHGDTPLHLALKNDHRDTVARLVLADRRPAAVTNNDQESPFDLAVRAEINLDDLSRDVPNKLDEEEFLTLYEEKFRTSSLDADLNMRVVRLSDDIGKYGDVEVEEMLSKLNEAVEAGREVDVTVMLKIDPKLFEYKNQRGRTAIHTAASNGCLGPLKIIIHFLERNGELRKLLEGDENDTTPLLHAIEGGHEEVACYLAEVAPRAVFKIDRLGRSPLRLAVAMGFLDLVRCVTRADWPRSVRERVYEDAKKMSIAHFAVKKRNLAVLQAILEGLPDLINSPDRQGWKVVSYAASKGYFEEFSHILRSFPDSSRNIDEDGSYPIHKAVAGGHVNVVKEFLLCCPQALHDTDRKGRNLLQVATLYQRKDVLSYLA